MERTAPEDISVLRVQYLEGKNNYLSTLEECKAVEIQEVAGMKNKNEEKQLLFFTRMFVTKNLSL